MLGEHIYHYELSEAGFESALWNNNWIVDQEHYQWVSKYSRYGIDSHWTPETEMKSKKALQIY